MNAMFRGAFGFVVGYLVFMLPTYVLPYFGSNSAIVGAIGAAIGRGLTPQFWLHAWCLGMLVLVTSIRGKHIGKGWLLIFPVLAGFFDLVPVLNLIPLVPTVMHLLALILGAMGSAAVLGDAENLNAPVEKAFSWEPWAAGLMSLSAISGTFHFLNGMKAAGKQVVAPYVPAPVNPKMGSAKAPEAVSVTSQSTTQSFGSSATNKAAAASISREQNSKALASQSPVKKLPRPAEVAGTPVPKKVEEKSTVRYIDINK